jgi:hypothetical protein
MATSEPKTLAATLVGITLSSSFVGANLGISYLAVPSLLLTTPKQSATTSSANAATPSPNLARQWRYLYAHAMPVAIAGSLMSSACFIYAALQLTDIHSAQRNLLIAAGTIVVLVVPYTRGLMLPTNSLLMERAAMGDAMEDVSEEDVTEVGMSKAQGLRGYRTEELLSRWGTLNYGRAAIQSIGIACAIAALLW